MRIFEIFKRLFGKTLFYTVLFLAFILGILWASNAVAATIAEDDFESYDEGGLDAENGGTGWAGAWAATGFNVVSGESDTDLQSAETTATNEPIAERTISPETHFVMEWDQKVSATGGNTFGVRLRSESQSKVSFNFNADATYSLNGNNEDTWEADTWYHFALEVDMDTDEARLKVNGGEWSSWLANVNSGDNIDTIWFIVGNGSSQEEHFDNIVISDEITEEPPGETATSTATTTASTASQEAFNGFLVFFLAMFFTVYVFKRR